ncbi:GFA family protein [soil metagenome]
MHLKGSCHCGAVRFSLESNAPMPFMRCYCSICRKTAGGGGFAINLGGDFKSMKVEGEDHISVYRALMNKGTAKEERSSGRRHFCNQCGSALWLWDPEWPDLVHPHASAIDTDLPVPPEHTHMMLGSKANWVEVDVRPHDKQFDEYPKESLAAFHERIDKSQKNEK